MGTPKFTAKISTLDETLALLRNFDTSALSEYLRASSTRTVLAVGSGGSSIAATYLAFCRETLGHCATLVQTPLETVLGAGSLRDVDVWLFSASADSSDIEAAANAALARKCRRVVVMTRNPNGATARRIAAIGGACVVVPVADSKDGYLATHSLVANIAAVLLASDALCDCGPGQHNALETLIYYFRAARAPHALSDLRYKFRKVAKSSTIIILADPRLSTLTTLLETSIWETALCNVQVTDFRNFAHGRHSWLLSRSDDVTVLAIASGLAQPIAQRTLANLPPRTSVVSFNYTHEDRWTNARTVLDGLFWIEAIGEIVGVDPGKPGVGDFGRTLFDDSILEDAEHELMPSVRQKLASAVGVGRQTQTKEAFTRAYWRKVNDLCDVEYRGIVLDYDGTLVDTKARLYPPSRNIVQELIRLSSEGAAIGIATGRGGSVGTALREAIDWEAASQIVVGYYNGGYIKPLNVDISSTRPGDAAVISEVASWLDTHCEIFARAEIKRSPIQVSIRFADPKELVECREPLLRCPALIDRRARLVMSAHSFDIIPQKTTKLNVIEAINQMIPNDSRVLTIGDQGAIGGNDFELLNRQYSISVGSVSPSLNKCWNLYGYSLTGPEATQKILKALRPSGRGSLLLSIAELELEKMH